MTEIDPVIHQHVIDNLAQIEEQHDVRILFAVESGSRAWGFASPDSDYDIRFVYSKRPDLYLSIDIEDQRDVIEWPISSDGLDISGWDLRKALRLLRKSNPSIIEWLQSPALYWEHGLLRTELKERLPVVYSPVAGWHHYRSMARHNLRNYLQSDYVRLKKYLYVLRGLLAARWVERTWTPPPLLIDELVDAEADRDLVGVPINAIRALLHRKRQVGELGLGEHIPELDQFIDAELARPMPASRDLPGPHDNSPAAMNEMFRQVLREPWI